jgi:regulator-associated protein of mTOR
VTDLRLINEDDQTLLMTGSSDGSVRIFKDYENRQQTKVMTSFSALPRPDLHATDYSLAMDWLQTRGEILTAGDSKSIRVWSASTELLSNVRFNANISAHPTN